MCQENVVERPELTQEDAKKIMKAIQDLHRARIRKKYYNKIVKECLKNLDARYAEESGRLALRPSKPKKTICALYAQQRREENMVNLTIEISTTDSKGYKKGSVTLMLDEFIQLRRQMDEMTKDPEEEPQIHIFEINKECNHGI